MDTMNKFLKVNEMDYAHSLQNGAMTRKLQDAIWNVYMFDRLE